jgi:hypothetical protein
VQISTYLRPIIHQNGLENLGVNQIFELKLKSIQTQAWCKHMKCKTIEVRKYTSSYCCFLFLNAIYFSFYVEYFHGNSLLLLETHVYLTSKLH